MDGLADVGQPYRPSAYQRDRIALLIYKFINKEM